jgi:hypothetical protein
MILSIIQSYVSEAIAPLFLGLAGLQAVGGLYRMFSAKSGLNTLHSQAFPEFKETPEQRASRMRAEGMAGSGYTPQETAAFNQKLSRAQNTGYTRAMDVAPSQAQAVLAGANYANVGAQSDFASRDAQLHRQNIQYADKFSNQLQQLSNMNIQQQIQNRRMAEQALGQAANQGVSSAMEAGNTLIAGQEYGQQDKANSALLGLLNGKQSISSLSSLDYTAPSLRGKKPFSGFDYMATSNMNQNNG